MGALKVPAWVVLHIPHDSTLIPHEVLSQFCLDETELREELVRMTDHLTYALFAEGIEGPCFVRAPVSRLVVDVERFPTDANEPMASQGMGAVYRSTSLLTPLRHPISQTDRQALMALYYEPHHARLEAAVTASLALYGRCLLIDCHSFAGKALPYELADPAAVRPQICIGTDRFHTDTQLARVFQTAFEAEGWQVALNHPFSGSMVPSSHYQKDARVKAVMLEVNRKLYLNEVDATPLGNFSQIATKVKDAMVAAVSAVEEID